EPGICAGRSCLASCLDLASIERNTQFTSELRGAEGTARKIAVSYSKCGYFSLPAIGTQHNFFSAGVFFDIHFTKAQSALLQKGFGAPAVRAPMRGVHRDGIVAHSSKLDDSKNTRIQREIFRQRTLAVLDRRSTRFVRHLNSNQRPLQRNCGAIP